MGAIFIYIYDIPIYNIIADFHVTYGWQIRRRRHRPKNDKAFRCVTLSPLWDNIFARCPCYVESIVKRVCTRPSELERLGTAWVSTANRLAPEYPCLGTKETIDPSSQGLHRIQLHTCLKCHCWQIRSLYRAQMQGAMGR
jgi:hypothetical protein